jgi:hypothetical protein
MGRIAAVFALVVPALMTPDGFAQRVVLPTPEAAAPAAPTALPPYGEAPTMPVPTTSASGSGPGYSPYGPPSGSYRPPPAGPAMPVLAPTNLAGRMTTVLTDSSMLFGTLEEPASWKLTTDYGEITVPPEKLQRVTVSGNGGSAKFFLTNGDVLSGKLSAEKIRLKAAWGAVDIETKYVSTLGSGTCPPPSIGPYPPSVSPYPPSVGGWSTPMPSTSSGPPSGSAFGGGTRSPSGN